MSGRSEDVYTQSKPAVRRSFRDPAGYVLRTSGRVLRVVERLAVEDLDAFLRTDEARKLTNDGRLIGTNLLDSCAVNEIEATCGLGLSSSADRVVYEHERVEFASYPYEWPPEMLHAAGCLTLDIARSVLRDGFGLKDATPYNILFRGPRPVFVDLLSFERRQAGDAQWLPYAQFLRTFLLPLAASRTVGLRLDDVLLNRRDGIEPEDFYRLLSWPRRLRPPYLSLATLPTWLAATHRPQDLKIYADSRAGDPDKASFVLSRFLRHVQRILDRLRPMRRQSAWTGYESQNSYTPEQAETKRKFVESALGEFNPETVIDIGCNAGGFSFMAARAGAAVVAIDSDPEVVGSVWREAIDSGLAILPLVVNIARPSPAMGWRYTECDSFLERARQSFDAVLMLAVLHHLLVTERVPLQQVVDLAAEMTRKIAIIEFVGFSDPMFRQIARGRETLHEGLTTGSFEAACATRFEILQSERLPGADRWLYLLRKSDS